MTAEASNLEKKFKLFRKIVRFIKKDFKSVLNVLLIVVVGIIVYVFLQLILHELQELKEDSQTLISYSNGNESPEEVKNTFEKDKVINNILEDLLENTQSDRAYLFQLHNGRRSIGGTSFLYISGTHEVVRLGISQDYLQLRNVPASITYEQNLVLVNKDYFCFRSIEDVEGVALRELLRQQAVESICVYGVFKGDILVGFVGVDYVITEMPQDVKKVKAQLNFASIRIGDVLYHE